MGIFCVGVLHYAAKRRSVEFPVFELGAIGKGHVGKGFEFELSFFVSARYFLLHSEP